MATGEAALTLTTVTINFKLALSSRTDSRSHSSFTPPVLQQVCHIYHRHLGEWTRVILYENNVFYEGAFIPWHDRLGERINEGFNGSDQSFFQFCLEALQYQTATGPSPGPSWCTNLTQ